MNVSVIVCTYNRSENLSKALDSLAASAMPPNAEWEVLVVDNNSKDETHQIVDKFCVRYPERFRYLFEPNQGKSHALNTGIRHARGAILAFTDDDVTVEPAWLANLTAVLRDDAYAGSAGRILPAPTLRAPAWLAVEGPYCQMGAICPCFDQGDEPLDLTKPAFGANMAFRKEMFDKYGTFRLDLGPSAKARVTYEDTEFCGRLLASGERLRYLPSAVVYHEIFEERIRKENILKWWFDLGVGGVREARTNLTPLQCFKVFGRIVITAIEGCFSFNQRKRFYNKCRVWWGAGKLREAFQRATRAAV